MTAAMLFRQPAPVCNQPGCGSDQIRRYLTGNRCHLHTPAALAGKPEPDAGRYCAPARCTCGGCPSWRPLPAYNDGATILDHRAIASGRRRASLGAYRAAQAHVAASR